MRRHPVPTRHFAEDADFYIKIILAVGVLVMVGGGYLYNATNGAADDIPMENLLMLLGLIVGFYFARRKKD